jgi:hypothetical protein
VVARMSLLSALVRDDCDDCDDCDDMLQDLRSVLLVKRLSVGMGWRYKLAVDLCLEGFADVRCFCAWIK